MSAAPVLVTGASGFIGRRLVARALHDGRVVRALVLPGEVLPAEWDARVEVVRGDVASPEDVARACEGAVGAIHLAALVADWGAESEHARITVGGTRNVLEHLPPAARFLLVSSVAVYGDALGREVCDEERALGAPMGPYGRSKQAQERLAREAARVRPVVIVRPGNVFGAGSGPWVRDLAAQLRRGGPAIVGDGRGNAGLAFVGNLVELLWAAFDRDAAAGRVYNANDGAPISWRRYVEDLARLCGAAPPKSVPAFLAWAAARAVDGARSVLGSEGRPPLTREAVNLLAANHRVPIERARRELGLAPRVGYEEAMEEVARSLR